MSYVFRCLEMVGLMHNDFVEICMIQAYSKLQIVKLMFPLNKYKAVYPWCCIMDRFQNSNFQHLIYFLLESFFQVNWNWLKRGFALVSHLDPIESLRNLFFTCDQPGSCMLLSSHSRFFSQTMNSHFRLCLLRVIN